MLTRWPLITQAAGAAIALAAGLSLGGYMKPQLITDHPLGPQMLTPQSAARTGQPADDGVILARYGGKLPDYVLGTDVTRPMVAQASPVAYREPPPQDDQPAPQDVDDRAYPDQGAEPSRDPSADGGAEDRARPATLSYDNTAPHDAG